MDPKIKRPKIFDFLSHDHHHGLLFCSQIRTGLKDSVDPLRIKAYCIWMFEQQFKSHFEIEERFIFPALGKNHEMVKKALADHRKIKRLLQNEKDVFKAVNLIEEVLEQHIRFEEHILFPEIENTTTVGDYAEMNHAMTKYQIYEEKEWTDKFW